MCSEALSKCAFKKLCSGGDIKYVSIEGAFHAFSGRLNSYVLAFEKGASANPVLRGNLQKSPEFAFAHFICETNNPDHYAEEFGVLKVTQGDLDRSVRVIEGGEVRTSRYGDILSETEFSYDEFYAEDIAMLIGWDLDAEFSSLVDRTELMKAYLESPIDDHASILSDWQDTFNEELGLLLDRAVIAFSQSFAESIDGLVKIEKV